MHTDLSRLEFDRVLSVVSSLAGSARGAGLVSRLEPAADRAGSVSLALETIEAASLLSAGASLPGASADPLFDVISLLETGAVALEPASLRAAAEALDSLSSFRARLDATGLPWRDGVLAGRLLELPDLAPLTRHLLRITTPEGTVAPDASDLLARLARSAARLRDGLARDAARISERMVAAGVSRDAPPTLRDGRTVIPVVAARRASVPGMIHDRSDSGGTLFIEPAELLETGNRLQETLMEMAQEERRILREATAMLRESAGPVKAGA
ncbi:MAG TPA: hypothetical protein P5266_07305, partial [Candidatus Fermentibacter sp.]|nr:hypothetical protein [Candidatus Fermentibacter sp.]